MILESNKQMEYYPKMYIQQITMCFVSDQINLGMSHIGSLHIIVSH
jgi:hypothetical protein